MRPRVNGTLAECNTRNERQLKPDDMVDDFCRRLLLKSSRAKQMGFAGFRRGTVRIRAGDL